MADENKQVQGEVISMEAAFGGGGMDSLIAEQGATGRDSQMSGITGGVQVGGKYATATKVMIPRNNAAIAVRLKEEATLSGEAMFYGWGSGKDKIMGPSIKLAQAAVRQYGNVAIEVGKIQDTEDAWIFTTYFIDLETGYTAARQFRQSKTWIVYGKMDAERKNDVRFQIGMSKAIRNVIISCLPDWMIAGAMEAAQNGVRAKVLNFIQKKGIAAAHQTVLNALKKHGVSEDDVVAKCEVANVKAIDTEMVVMLRGCIHALDNGIDYADELFPTMKESVLDESQPQDVELAEADKAFGGATDSDSKQTDANGGTDDEPKTKGAPKPKAVASKKANEKKVEKSQKSLVDNAEPTE